MRHYLKFLMYNISIVLGTTSLLFAQHYILIGTALFISMYLIGDALLGDDTHPLPKQSKAIADALLFTSVPCTLYLLTVILWLTTSSQWQWMDSLSSLLAYDFVAAKSDTNVLEYLVFVLFAGLMLSGVATIVGHELIHRLADKKSHLCGRWLLALSLDANFSIEHVFGHHTKVATFDDPATAPRGRNVYVHVLFALFKTNLSAWEIEKKRILKTSKRLVSLHNRCIRGWLMSLMVVLAFAVAGGIYSALAILVIGFISKVALEIVNYMEHYGLVRHPRQRVEPRHSWNSNKKISSWAMFNLPRHSHHHAKGAVPFHELEAYPEAPQMISGYISTMAIALIPPLWFKMMAPRLAHWDKHYANDAELQILALQARGNTDKHTKEETDQQALI